VTSQPTALWPTEDTTLDNANDKKEATTTEPRPDWWWEIKQDRPWVVIHAEDGPPVRTGAPDKPMDDDDTYFQPRWAEVAQLLDGPSPPDTQPGLGHRRPRPTFTEMKAKLLPMIHRDVDQ